VIALIVHGTSNRVFEDIIQLHDYLCQFAEVTCTAVGTSCIKPLYDLGLEGRIEFFKHETVSDAILSLSERCEAIICYNESKNMESSNRFKSFLRTRIGAVRCPVLYIDNFNASYLTEFQHAIFEGVLNHVKRDLVASFPRGDHHMREVHGAVVGESIWINGNVVGIVEQPHPRIWKDDDNNIRYHGIRLKEHGLFHVGDFNPMEAKIRTGYSSNQGTNPRCSKTIKKSIAYIIDHDAEEGVRYSFDGQYAITIGDDTTKNSSSLLYRFSVPIIGIIDGDEDGICQEDLRFPGSIIFQVIPGQDDVIGEQITQDLFGGVNQLENPPDIESMAGRIQDIIGDRLVSRMDENSL